MTFLKVGIKTKWPLLELHISKHLIDRNEHLTKLGRNPIETKHISLKLRVELTILHHSAIQLPDVICIAKVHVETISELSLNPVHSLIEHVAVKLEESKFDSRELDVGTATICLSFSLFQFDKRVAGVVKVDRRYGWRSEDCEFEPWH